MKYLVSSQEKPQYFPIYLVHSDMDSFIMYNAETNSTNNEPVLAAKPKEIKKGKTSVQIEEISDTNDDSDNKGKSNENKN